jgi:hypothetical protein
MNLYIQTISYSGCPAISWVGDGYCDDETNIEECQFDGGDCCLENVDLMYCTVCVCHETGIEATLAPGGKYCVHLHNSCKQTMIYTVKVNYMDFDFIRLSC